MKFSRTELIHLARAWIIISIAFAIAFTGFSLTNAFLIAILVSALTVGVGFLFHELAHKYFAQRYGCWAEFRAFDKMLVLALFLSFFGFIFAAPGGVYIKGNIPIHKRGRISLAGPVTNMILALLFFGLIFAVPQYAGVMVYGMYINAILGLFNMLPIPPIDGFKILKWSKSVFAIFIIIAAGIMFFSFRVFSTGFAG